MDRDFLIIEYTCNLGHFNYWIYLQCVRDPILYNLIPQINEFCSSFSWDFWVHRLFILILQVWKKQSRWELPLQLYYILCCFISFFSCILILMPAFNRLLNLKVSLVHLVKKADWHLYFSLCRIPLLILLSNFITRFTFCVMPAITYHSGWFGSFYRSLSRTCK